MRSSTVLLFLFALVGISQGTIYWPHGGQDSDTKKSDPKAVEIVYRQLHAINEAYANKDTEALSHLIDDTGYVALKAHDIDTITYVGDCIFGGNVHETLWAEGVHGKVMTNRGVFYDIHMFREDESSTGYKIGGLFKSAQ